MGLKKYIKRYILGESIKEIEMNRILDKIYKKINLSSREKKFLDLYNHTSNDDNKDYMYLSKNSTFSRIRYLLDKDRKVICDLHDRNGRIGLPIIDITNNIESDTCKIIMSKEEHDLHDRFLYNLIYNDKGSYYSLQEQDEYFEKIEAKND
jgi:hypothetical protein